MATAQDTLPAEIRSGRELTRLVYIVVGPAHLIIGVASHLNDLDDHTVYWAWALALYCGIALLLLRRFEWHGALLSGIALIGLVRLVETLFEHDPSLVATTIMATVLYFHLLIPPAAMLGLHRGWAWTILGIVCLLHLIMALRRPELSIALGGLGDGRFSVAFAMSGSLYVYMIARWRETLINATRTDAKIANLTLLADTDRPTGSLNRGAGTEILQSMINARQEMTIALVDIDNFKLINDSYGHPYGDQVILRVVRKCKMNLRSEDVLIRWGGDEFLVIIPDLSESDSRVTLDRLRANIKKDLEMFGEGLTISIGASTLRPEETLRSILDRVDAALYEAKASGRDTVIVAS